MEGLIRRRNLPNVYVGDSTFTTARAARNLMENGNACPGSLQRHASIAVSTSSSDVDVNRRVTFNVGGTCFQTTEKSFKEISAKYFKAKDIAFLDKHYDNSRDEFFFDRDPEVFRSVLNYWRTGHLHIPTTMCGPQIIDEMEFWGLSAMDIEPCCFNTYNSWIKSMHALQKLEKDRQLSYLKPKIIKPDPRASTFKRLSRATWYTLTDPSYSKYAKIYAYVSLFFVTLAIFSFCASTHYDFTVVVGNQSGATDTPTSVSSGINNSSIITAINSTSLPTISNLANTTATIITNNVQSPLTPGCKNKTASKEPKVERDVHPALTYIDHFCLILFTLEYLIRLLCAPKRCAFIISFTAIIDFLAILPDYIEFVVFAFYPENSSNQLVQFMPFLRLMRVFRIFRLVQRVPGLWIMIYTLRASFKELSLMLMFLLVGTLFFSSVIFFVDDQTVFKSIPHSFWWAIVTMTTVGYGDMTPKTVWGQIMGSITAVCGVLLVGFTIPALVNNFITYCQFIEFAMRNQETIEQDVKRVSRRHKSRRRGRRDSVIMEEDEWEIEDTEDEDEEGEKGGGIDKEGDSDTIDLKEVKDSNMSDEAPDSPLNQSHTPLTISYVT